MEGTLTAIPSDTSADLELEEKAFSSRRHEREEKSSPPPVHSNKIILNNSINTRKLTELFEKHEASWKLYRKKHGPGVLRDQLLKKKDDNVKSVGLYNQGATCYMNSLLQSLFAIEEFRAKVLNCTMNDSNSILPELQWLFSRLQLSEFSAITTVRLTKAFGWDRSQSYEQQDAHEMCRVLFSALEDEGENGKSITSVFQGEVEDYVKCLECSSRKARRETFEDISIAAQGVNSVEEAILDYIKPETLNGDNQYECDTCKHKTDAIKGLSFVKLPKVWLLHLKRFVFDWEHMERFKLQDRVDIPLQFNATAFMNDREGSHSGNSIIYSLSAVVVHVGTAKFGHYFAVIKDTKSGCWIEFNDADTSVLNESDLVRYFGSSVGTEIIARTRGNSVPGTRDACNTELAGTLASGGAYMLLYQQENQNANGLSMRVPDELAKSIRDENDELKLMSKIQSIASHMLSVDVYTAVVEKNSELENVQSILRKVRIHVHDQDTSACFFGRCATALGMEEPVQGEGSLPRIYRFNARAQNFEFTKSQELIPLERPTELFRMARAQNQVQAVYYHSGETDLPELTKETSANATVDVTEKKVYSLKFNDPNMRPAVFEHEIQLPTTCTVAEAKELILHRLVLVKPSPEVSELTPGDIHVRLSQRSKPIRDESESLEKLQISDGSFLVIGRGGPVPLGKLLVKVYLGSSLDDINDLEWQKSREKRKYLRGDELFQRMYDCEETIVDVKQDIVDNLQIEETRLENCHLHMRVHPNKLSPVAGIFPIGMVLRGPGTLASACRQQSSGTGIVRIILQPERKVVLHSLEQHHGSSQKGGSEINRSTTAIDRLVTTSFMVCTGDSREEIKVAWLTHIDPHRCTWKELWQTLLKDLSTRIEVEDCTEACNYVLTKVSSVNLKRMAWWGYESFDADMIVGRYPMVLTDTSEILLCHRSTHERVTGGSSHPLVQSAGDNAAKQVRAAGVKIISKSASSCQIPDENRLSTNNFEITANKCESSTHNDSCRNVRKGAKKHISAIKTGIEIVTHSDNSVTKGSNESQSQQGFENGSSKGRLKALNVYGTLSDDQSKVVVEVSPTNSATSDQSACTLETNESNHQPHRYHHHAPPTSPNEQLSSRIVTQQMKGLTERLDVEGNHNNNETISKVENTHTHHKAQSNTLKDTRPASLEVPALNLAPIMNNREPKSYHDEFMSNSHLWSQSWRDAAKELATSSPSNSDCHETPFESTAKNFLNSQPPTETTIEDKVCWKVEDRVLAKAHSWKRYHPACVKERNKIDNTYQVLFDDGETIHNLPGYLIRQPLSGRQHGIPITPQKSVNQNVTATSPNASLHHQKKESEGVQAPATYRKRDTVSSKLLMQQSNPKPRGLARKGKPASIALRKSPLAEKLTRRRIYRESHPKERFRNTPPRTNSNNYRPSKPLPPLPDAQARRKSSKLPRPAGKTSSKTRRVSQLRRPQYRARASTMPGRLRATKDPVEHHGNSTLSSRSQSSTSLPMKPGRVANEIQLARLEARHKLKTVSRGMHDSREGHFTGGNRFKLSGQDLSRRLAPIA